MISMLKHPIDSVTKGLLIDEFKKLLAKLK
jgi:hypothetical protein